MVRLAKGELCRAAHLAPSGSFHDVVTCREYTTECTYVKELAAQPFHSRFLLLVFGSIRGQISVAFLNTIVDLVVKYGTLSDEQVVAIAIVASALGWERFHEVAYLALEAYVGDDTPIGVVILTRHVASIGIAIGISVGDFKEQQDVVPIGENIVAWIH